MSATPENSDPLFQFLVWGIRSAGGDLVFSDGKWAIEYESASIPPALTGPLDPNQLAAHPEIFKWLAAEIRAKTKLPVAAVSRDVQRVAELTDSLYSYYHVEGGTVRLAGCQLEDRFFLRLTFLHQSDGQSSLVHLMKDRDGRPIEDDLREVLLLDQLNPASLIRHDIDEASVYAYADRQETERESDSNTEFLLGTVVAAKWVDGKLEFVNSDATAALPFQGWAIALRDGADSMPAYRCPVTNIEGFHLAATDTGELSLKVAIDTCQISGRRLLVSQLAKCVVSGRRVDIEGLVKCPISAELLLESELVGCDMCGEMVSPLIIAGERCRACRHLEKVAADDPRIQKIIELNPDMQDCKYWRLAETERVYIAQTIAWWKTRLLVVDKNTLASRRVARANRWHRKWQETQVDEDQ